MFQEFSPKMREHIISTGEVEFIADMKCHSANLMTSYMKHRIIFRYYESGEADEVGDFYLTLQNGHRYEMARLRITANIGQALKLFMMELILKAAIKEAQQANVFDVVVDCTEKLIADAFLTCRFSIERFKSNIYGGYDIFRGKKSVK